MSANRIFYIVVILAILTSASVSFLKFVINKDYQIVAETSCDPITEHCFVHEDGSFYKLISKKAAVIVACEETPEKLGCSTELSCLPQEKDCTYVFCDSNTAEEDQACAPRQ